MPRRLYAFLLKTRYFTHYKALHGNSLKRSVCSPIRLMQICPISVHDTPTAQSPRTANF